MGKLPTHFTTGTLAEVLQGAGYATAAFVSGPTVMAHYGFGQGFASYDEVYRGLPETARPPRPSPTPAPTPAPTPTPTPTPGVCTP